MSKTDPIRDAARAYRRPLWTCGLLSLAINVIMLSSPLFMLQIYDRVLTSRSFPTLVALTLLISALFILAAFFEIVRMRLLGRVASGVTQDLAEPTFRSILSHELTGRFQSGNQPLRDLETLSRFITGPGPGAFFDLPWMPIYICLAYLLHPWIGMLTLAAAIALLIIAILNERLSSTSATSAANASLAAHALTESVRNASEAVWAMGMDKPMGQRWQSLFTATQEHNLKAVDVASTFQSYSRFLRLFLQSACLALGAGLAIQGDLSAGAIIAASIILSRALAPVEQITGQWSNLQSAKRAWSHLSMTLQETSAPSENVKLPAPEGALTLDNVSVRPPGANKPVIEGITLKLQSGEAMGVIGPSGSGKSTLIRALTGAWQPNTGAIRLDGAELGHWPHDQLGPAIGYVPQDVELSAGTVRDNISRFLSSANDEQVVRAATRAGVHDLILKLPNGYSTELGPAGCQLSAGQRQRIALARALFGDPKLLILDEPNSNLDAKGELSLSQALMSARADGVTIVVVSHRPQLLKIVDKILVLEAGRQVAFGPRTESLITTPAPTAPADLASKPVASISRTRASQGVAHEFVR